MLQAEDEFDEPPSSIVSEIPSTSHVVGSVNEDTDNRDEPLHSIDIEIIKRNLSLNDSPEDKKLLR